MTSSKMILKLAEKNNGIVKSSELDEDGLSRGSLKYLVDSGKLERVSRGVYVLPEVWDDEFVNLQTRFKKGIYSLETALFLCDLTDLTPSKFCMTFPATYNLTFPKKAGILCHSAKDVFYSMGIEQVKTPGGNLVYAYGPEKTLCDILVKKNKVNIQLINHAFKTYVRRKDKNIPLLSDYAKQLHVEKYLRSYLEVLL